MAQVPLQLAYKEAEQRILNVINECISLGLPMFLIENILKEISTEVSRQSEAQYQESVKTYNEAVAAEQAAAATEENKEQE